MTPQHDILLPSPLPEWVLRPLLFGVFELHLAFALLTLGVTLIAGIELLAGRSPQRALRTFSTQKSLAVVIGVGVLILMLVFEPVPMLRGINRVAPGWLLLVVLLVIALAAIEYSAHLYATPRLRRIVFFTGMLFLLAVPAVFSGMVVSVENPNVWQSTGQPPPSWPGHLGTHYVLRLAHVLGAAVVFSAALLLFWGRPPRSCTVRLRRWLETALWFQVIIGIALLSLLPHAPTLPVLVAIIVAVSGAAIVAKMVADQDGQMLARQRRGTVAGLLVVLLTGMLLARQFLQDQVLAPINTQLQADARQYGVVLAQIEQEMPPPKPSAMARRSRPAVTFGLSCSFCHGGVGNGQGDDAPRLRIPPEDLTAVRAQDSYVYTILRTGVPGTPMPVFDYYTRQELDQLIAFLHRLGLRNQPEPSPVMVTPAMEDVAQRVFAQVCTDCHGQGGRGDGPSAASVLPKPPDFTRYVVSPERAFWVITWGYPGTAMPRFTALPEELRWALAGTVNAVYEEATSHRYAKR